MDLRSYDKTWVTTVRACMRTEKKWCALQRRDHTDLLTNRLIRGNGGKQQQNESELWGYRDKQTDKKGELTGPSQQVKWRVPFGSRQLIQRERPVRGSLPAAEMPAAHDDHKQLEQHILWSDCETSEEDQLSEVNKGKIGGTRLRRKLRMYCNKNCEKNVVRWWPVSAPAVSAQYVPGVLPPIVECVTVWK